MFDGFSVLDTVRADFIILDLTRRLDFNSGLPPDAVAVALNCAGSGGVLACAWNAFGWSLHGLIIC